MIPRPFRVRLMQTQNGTLFSVRCRACGMTFGYMSDLDEAFDSVARHIDLHRREKAKLEQEQMLESQQ